MKLIFLFEYIFTRKTIFLISSSTSISGLIIKLPSSIMRLPLPISNESPQCLGLDYLLYSLSLLAYLNLISTCFLTRFEMKVSCDLSGLDVQGKESLASQKSSRNTLFNQPPPIALLLDPVDPGSFPFTSPSPTFLVGNAKPLPYLITPLQRLHPAPLSTMTSYLNPLHPPVAVNHLSKPVPQSRRHLTPSSPVHSTIQHLPKFQIPQSRTLFTPVGILQPHHNNKRTIRRLIAKARCL